jgi:PAS domain S-box-containing protein
MTETMQEVFWLRTVDEILHVSDSFQEVWGRPVEDIYADPNAYLDDVHPDDWDQVAASCHKLLHEEQPILTEYRIIRKSDGKTRWVRVHFRPVGNETGPARFAGTIRDATDEIESQKQLEMSEQTYRNVIDHASDAIYVQNENGEFLDLSEGAVQMYGYSREELLGKTPAFVSAPGKNDLERVRQFFSDALNGTPQQFEFWGQRADGSIFPKEVRLQKTTYFGEPVVVAFALDISTRVAAEEALRESEQRYRLVVKNMKDMVMLHDADGGTLWASPSVREVTGRTPEQAIQLGAFDVIHPDDQERVVHHLAKLHDGLNQGPIIYRIRHHDGYYIWVETLVQATYSDDGTLERIQSASRDVTERKRQQEELREAKRNAEDADRLKSAMLANMSHEIRTPLTSIIGFSEVLQDEVDPTYQKFASLIYNSSRRLMQTLDSVLQLSKLEAGLIDLEVAPVNLREELQETLDLLRPQAQEKGIHLSVKDLDHVTVTGTWDGGAMHRILANLVGNAIKFTGDGGHVQLSAEERGDMVHLRVRDDGIGIDPAFMPHIFEPFKQETGGMRRSYEGTGLGLAIVQRLVEMMGGTIDVESEKGRGTTFTVILPITPTVTTAAPLVDETP